MGTIVASQVTTLPRKLAEYSWVGQLLEVREFLARQAEFEHGFHNVIRRVACTGAMIYCKFAPVCGAFDSNSMDLGWRAVRDGLRQMAAVAAAEMPPRVRCTAAQPLGGGAQYVE